MLNWKQKYPQNIWSAKISSLLKKQLIFNNSSVLYWDAPCGNGLVSYLVSKDWPTLKFRLLDNNQALMSSPFILNQNERFKANLGDIFLTKLPGSNNVWFLINSLYCLPDSEKLIESQRDYFKQIVIIVPDKEASNFKYFTKQNPEFKNPSLRSLEETKILFENKNYQLLFQERIAKISFHYLSSFLDRMFFPPQAKNLFLTILDKIFFWKKGQYVIMIFERNE